MGDELERAREYGAQAAEFDWVVERMVDLKQRTLLLDLATTYHRMAEQLEEIFRLGGNGKGVAHE